MNIGIMGSYGEGNTGDETILLGIIQQIRDCVPDANIYVFSHNPKYTDVTFADITAMEVLPAGFRSVTKQRLLLSLKKSHDLLKTLDAVLVGGGGIFYDHLFSEGKNPIKVWHTRISKVASFNVPIFLYAVGVAELQHEESREYMREICEMATGIMVRDHYSKKRLQEMGVTKEIFITPDPAWYARIPSSNAEEKYIGLNLRYWPKVMEMYPHHITLWAEYFTWLSKRGKLKFLAFSWRKDNDLNYLGQIMKHTNIKIQTPILETPEMAFQEVESCKYVIGMRLHSQILAIKAHRKIGAIAYHSKVTTQLEKCHVPILGIEKLTLEELQNFTKLVEESPIPTVCDNSTQNAFEIIRQHI